MIDSNDRKFFRQIAIKISEHTLLSLVVISLWPSNH